MTDLTVHHLPITTEHVRGNGGRGRLFFLPGSDGRARRIGERFTGLEIHQSERQHNVYLGQLSADDVAVDVAAISTGMGCASLHIILTELILLGARLFIRVGTAGSLQPKQVRAGSLVIATAAVRDEGTSDRIAVCQYPAVGDLGIIAHLETAARALGYGDRTYKGIVQSKNALYALELGHGPRRPHNEAHMAELRALGVLASDMETSHLFVLTDAHSTEIAPITQTSHSVLRAGAILAVVGDDEPYAEPELMRETEAAAIAVALRSATELLRAP